MNPTPTKTRVVHVNDKIADAVYVGSAMPRQRLKASPLANPYRVKQRGLAGALSRYAIYLQNEITKGNPEIIEALIECRGKPLACWCRHDFEGWEPGKECHADLIMEFLRAYSDETLRTMTVAS